MGLIRNLSTLSPLRDTPVEATHNAEANEGYGATGYSTAIGNLSERR